MAIKKKFAKKSNALRPDIEPCDYCLGAGWVYINNLTGRRKVECPDCGGKKLAPTPQIRK